MPTKDTQIPVASIRVGKRFRRDLGDLTTLMESIDLSRWAQFAQRGGREDP
jgi:hypothetical protein